jgi:hypothetical protein
MRTLLAFAATTVLVGLGVIAYETTTASSDTTSRRSDVGSQIHAASAAMASTAPRDATPSPLGARSLADVGRHEQALVAKARRTMRPLERAEMAQLHAAIDALALDDRISVQAHRELSNRLRLLAVEIELAPTQAELAQLLAEMRTQRPGVQRDRLAATYRVTANKLPPMHRNDALARVDTRK